MPVFDGDKLDFVEPDSAHEGDGTKFHRAEPPMESLILTEYNLLKPVNK